MEKGGTIEKGEKASNGENSLLSLILLSLFLYFSLLSPLRYALLLLSFVSLSLSLSLFLSHIFYHRFSRKTLSGWCLGWIEYTKGENRSSVVSYPNPNSRPLGLAEYASLAPSFQSGSWVTATAARHQSYVQTWLRVCIPAACTGVCTRENLQGWIFALTPPCNLPQSVDGDNIYLLIDTGTALQPGY